MEEDDNDVTIAASGAAAGKIIQGVLKEDGDAAAMAGGEVVDKLIPSFFLANFIVYFLLTLSLLPLLGANLVILHGVSQTILLEFLVILALTHGFSVLEKPRRNLWILAGTALYYTCDEVHILYPKLEENTLLWF